jgi:hypothetical protein
VGGSGRVAAAFAGWVIEDRRTGLQGGPAGRAGRCGSVAESNGTALAKPLADIDWRCVAFHWC